MLARKAMITGDFPRVSPSLAADTIGIGRQKR